MIGKAIEINGTVAAYHSNRGNALKELGRLEDAVAAYDAAIRIEVNHALSHLNKGIALQELGRPEDALAACDAAIRIKPGYAEAHFSRGNALKDLGRFEDALAAYETAIRIKPNLAEAHYSRGAVFTNLGRFEDALAAYETAIRIRPDFAEAHYSRGVVSTDLGRLGDALASYDAAIRIKPDYVEAHYNRAAALQDLDRLDDAIASYDAALRIRPDLAEALSNRGAALQGLGRVDDAIASYDAALRIRPDYAKALSNRGNALNDLGRLDEAIASYDAALRIRPDYAEAHYNRGNALKDLGRLDGAIASYDAALRVRPDYAEALSNRGNALRDLGCVDDAIASYNAALRIKPDYAEAFSNRGNALQDLGRGDDAIASYDAALRIRPDYGEALSNRGNALRDLGHVNDAIASYDAALRIRPDYAEALTNRGNALNDLGRVDDAIASYDAALRIRPDYAEAHSNLLFALYYRADWDGEKILTKARQFGAAFEKPCGERRFSNARIPDRRLRIGYVSADFRRHPVGYFLAPVLANHDRSAVEVFCYSCNTACDDLTERLKAGCDHWHSLVGVSDGEAASRIRGDGIDVLVDLSGHTAGNRLPLFARKPAPVQASWLGFWGTTGLRSMDWIVSDAVTIRPGEEAYYGERVMRLPHGRFCYGPPAYAPLPLRRSCGPLTFGSFNNLAKIGPEVVRLWSSVLTAVPDSRLLLKWRSLGDAVVRNRLTASFASWGIGPERLELRGASSHEVMLEEYGDVDIALDTFPFSGGLTSCEALWMGVPVVTLPGMSAPSRQTLGFLRALDLTSWAAESEGDYVRIAASLAGDGDGRSKWRVGLRERMASSSLCDGARMAGDLETAYRAMWRNWCSEMMG